MQNDFQRCIIKVAKFYFIILWYFGVIAERGLGIKIELSFNVIAP